MKAKSISGKSIKEIQSSLNESMSDGFNPTLAIVFLSIKLDREAICKILDKKGVSIFGATSAGEFTNKGIEKDSTAMLLVDLDPGAFEIVYAEFGSETPYNTARKLGAKGIERFSNPGFIISKSDIHQEGMEIVEGIIEASQTDTIIGGAAGDDNYEKTTVFSNDFHSHSGIIALIMDLDKVIMKGHAVSGWKPVGTEKTVTKSEENWILAIDNQPALDVLVNFLGMNVNSTSTNEELRDFTVNFPFEVYLENKKTILIPPLMFNKETKGILVPSGLPIGTKLRFTLPPDFDVIDRVVQSARDIKDESLDSADAMIIFSCVGRLMTLGPLVNEEIKGLDEVWKVPMAGFFSYGEFGSTPEGTPGFVGTTCSWVALKEK